MDKSQFPVMNTWIRRIDRDGWLEFTLMEGQEEVRKTDWTGQWWPPAPGGDYQLWLFDYLPYRHKPFVSDQTKYAEAMAALTDAAQSDIS